MRRWFVFLAAVLWTPAAAVAQTALDREDRAVAVARVGGPAELAEPLRAQIEQAVTARAGFRALGPQQLAQVAQELKVPIDDRCDVACLARVAAAARAPLLVVGEVQRLPGGGFAAGLRFVASLRGAVLGAERRVPAATAGALEAELKLRLPGWVADAADEAMQGLPERTAPLSPSDCTDRPGVRPCPVVRAELLGKTSFAVLRVASLFRNALDARLGEQRRQEQGARERLEAARKAGEGAAALAAQEAALRDLQARIAQDERTLKEDQEALPADALTEELRAAVLAASPGLAVREQEQVNLLVAAKSAGSTEDCTELCAVKMAQLAESDFVVKADLSRAGGASRLSLVLIDAREEKLVAQEAAEGADAPALHRSLRGVAARLMARFNALIDARVAAERDAEKRQIDARNAAIRSKEAALAAERMKVAADKPKRELRRKVGWTTALVAAGAGLLFTGYGIYSGASLNDKVKRGGYGSPAELLEAVDEGQTFNTVVKAVAIGTGAIALGGLLVVVLNQDPDEKLMGAAAPAEEAPAPRLRASLSVGPGALLAEVKF